jgi:uncharacterized protein YuzE
MKSDRSNALNEVLPMDTILSIHGVPIRLTTERWFHIVENHDDVAGYDYDQEADVLYISFARPQRATNSVMTADGLILRYCDNQLVGITILDASTRTPPLS